MIEIRPNALYSRQDLQEALRPLGVDADTFTARLRPRKVFRGLWRGSDLLEAWDRAPALAEKADGSGVPLPANRGNRRRRGAAVDDTLQPLQDLMAELKGRSNGNPG